MYQKRRHYCTKVKRDFRLPTGCRCDAIIILYFPSSDDNRRQRYTKYSTILFTHFVYDDIRQNKCNVTKILSCILWFYHFNIFLLILYETLTKIMEDLLACRACLATDTKLFNMYKFDLVSPYEMLTGIQASLYWISFNYGHINAIVM